MKALIVYCHPSDDSFTRVVRDAFIKCLEESCHSYEISDLYKMHFCADMSEDEYRREAEYDETKGLAKDVIEEQSKILRCDFIVFIYPIFWTEAPAKLVGWFDRVWTFGFAYGAKKMPVLEKCLFLCTAGRSIEHLNEHGHLESMKRVMIGDRLFGRTKEAMMYVFDGMSKTNPSLRDANWNRHLSKVREIASTL